MHRWKLSALAAAAFVSTALTTTDASALVLGNLTVRSSLGESLDAEIALPQASTAELNSLAAQIASAETFQAQGLDYSATAKAIQVQVQRNADGTASLRLSSSAPIQDPFVDLVLETQWNTGRMVRSYTLLLDPPTAQRAPVTPTAAPQVAPAPAPVSVTGRSYQSSGSQPQRIAAPAATTQPAPVAPTQRQAPAATSTPKPSATTNTGTTTVRTGDTAGRIANANRPAGVSLDQMLVAMLRSNPEAFINGNVNRIRAGAVVQMPTQEQALETSRSEARRIVAAQSRDFNAYRRSLASKAPQAKVQAADRSSSGQVQAHVAETRPTADTPDKLTLSKGAVQAANAESKLAEQKQAEDQDGRLNELQRNLAELNELAQSTTTPPAATAATAATAAAEATAETSEVLPPVPTAAEPSATPSVDVVNAEASTVTTPTAPASDTTTSTQAEAATASPEPTQEQAAAAATPAARPISEPSLSDELLANPMVPAGAGLVALLLGLLGYTAWKRRRAAHAAQDPSLGDSQLQPDSFFGGSGGQQVDTSDDNTGTSTMAYAPSQLDGGGDVDPVAEADVYLAYGRDVQAEEILKEALRSQPNRLSIHVKLAEIYVKRHDIKGLEEIARSMQTISNSQDAEWQRVVEMGRHLDPTNPFFAAANTTTDSINSSKPVSAFAAALSSIKPEPVENTAPAPQKLPDIDLNLDLPDDGLVNSPVNAATPVAASPTTPLPSDDDYAALDSKLDFSPPSSLQEPPTLVQDTQIPEDTGMDLDLSRFDIPLSEASSSKPESAPDLSDAPSLDFDLDTPVAAVAPSAPVPTPAAQPTESLNFDLGSLDLDLGAPPEPAAAAEPVHNLTDDPLSTKLDLAQEFNSIGDSEGARALIEEVLAEANGPLKDRAQKMLSELD